MLGSAFIRAERHAATCERPSLELTGSEVLLILRGPILPKRPLQGVQHAPVWSTSLSESQVGVSDGVMRSAPGTFTDSQSFPLQLLWTEIVL